MAWVDHSVIENLPLRLAKNWSNEVKDMSSVLTGGWPGTMTTDCVPNSSCG